MLGSPMEIMTLTRCRDCGRLVWEAEESQEREVGAREASMFWQAVMKEVRAMGSHALAGDKGQFDNFEWTQSGYTTSSRTFDAESIAPLNPTKFIQHILVPEVALITEDTGDDVAQATWAMPQSRQRRRPN
ncbi:hypothetical protein OF83DRAFT_1180438 [Amylostereum chailletii]|nr:hypothetical protein OF83DRAFT_1180438 [Amylostereum chailletii]